MKAFFSSIKVWFWVALAAAFGLLILFGKGFLTRSKVSNGSNLLPDPPKAILDAMKKAEENALVVRAETRVKTDEHKEQLAQITQVEDGAQRRKELAKFVDSL